MQIETTFGTRLAGQEFGFSFSKQFWVLAKGFSRFQQLRGISSDGLDTRNDSMNLPQLVFH